MSSDIVERLRAKRTCSVCCGGGTTSKGRNCGGCHGDGMVYVFAATGLQAADHIEALQAELAKAREALEKAAELAQEKSEELVNRWTSDLGATVETQAAGAAAHIVAGLAGDILGLLAKAERSALHQKEREA